MLKSQVKARQFYVAKVSDKITIVQLLEHKRGTHWSAFNLRTGKTVNMTSGKCRINVLPQNLTEYGRAYGFDPTVYGQYAFECSKFV